MKERGQEYKAPTQETSHHLCRAQPLEPLMKTQHNIKTADTWFRALLSCGSDPFYFTCPVSLSTEHIKSAAHSSVRSESETENSSWGEGEAMLAPSETPFIIPVN